MKIRKRSDCPVSSTLDILGDKWSLLIIRDIMFQGKNTYGDFAQSAEKIATNILADRLMLLDEAGIVEKKDHPESKAKFYYRLTEKGINLMPLLMEVILWGDKYMDISAEARIFARQIRKDKGTLLKALSVDLRKQTTKERARTSLPATKAPRTRST